ncbi:cell wall-associated NlpC family hydrolase [Streptosporangium album]|uniref:Cell wall-associated NlpC family hydrolase n=1 Tax=Streptosporangium album TaxID=47479 RepID=A0A7W7RU86_9ACTN|nr:C40 family peptidase [Streptosporangium album]MBB4937556.1 cell wall-associated NlpC family hydrolase [Streptosporangium album]
MLDRRTRVSGLIHEARQDLAYRPRIRYGRRLPRQVFPAVVLLLVAALATGVVVVTQLPERSPETVAMRRPVARQTVQSGVATAEPTHTPPQPVAALTSIHRPHLFVVAAKPLRSAVVAKVAQVAGVRAVERADAAEVGMDGKRVQTLGVNPSTFRAYTPKPTARSDRLWRNVSAGEIAVSFVLGNDGGMPLGKSVTTAGRSLRVGAYATMGMGAIDAVVSRQTARALGIPENNALVVSAPKVDSAKLRRTLLRILPRGSQIATINPVLSAPQRTTWAASAFMTAPQIKVALTAAASKLGRPYVWGAEGPDTFDCSGLVQWAYAQAGIKVPRVTHQQFVSGPQIPLSQAQPGDLLFWRHDPTNPTYVSHVAIYWGNGKMLQAPRTGDVVKISPVGTRNFAGVVRISPAIAARVR